jgi:ATP-binding protein involved in chromosome partitioning
MYNREQILEALAKVIHPEKGIDIIKMGLVSEITSGEDGISITLSPDKPNDPFISSIKSTVTRALKEHLGTDVVVNEITVRSKVEAPKHHVKEKELLSGIKNIIAVSSGKGGVGKSTIAVNLAIALGLKGYRVGLLDADIFGPSVPRMFDAEDFHPEVIRKEGKDVIIPLDKYGVKVLSTGFFVSPSDAVIWRGPMASGFLKQLMDQGDWGELDYLIFDLPPGTSDIHLTLVQEVPVTGAIVVSTPQEVALADAVKGISMFQSEKINVPVLGLVENMSWFTPAELPDKKYYIFGREGCKALAEKTGVPLLGQIPLVQGICESSDNGTPVVLDGSVTAGAFLDLADEVIDKVEKRNRDQKPTIKVEINNNH